MEYKWCSCGPWMKRQSRMPAIAADPAHQHTPPRYVHLATLAAVRMLSQGLAIVKHYWANVKKDPGLQQMIDNSIHTYMR